MVTEQSPIVASSLSLHSWAVYNHLFKPLVCPCPFSWQPGQGAPLSEVQLTPPQCALIWVLLAKPQAFHSSFQNELGHPYANVYICKILKVFKWFRHINSLSICIYFVDVVMYTTLFVNLTSKYFFLHPSWITWQWSLLILERLSRISFVCGNSTCTIFFLIA